MAIAKKKGPSPKCSACKKRVAKIGTLCAKCDAASKPKVAPEQDRKLEQSPIDSVLRVTELEAARFVALDVEIRNGLLVRRNIELEIEAAERSIMDAVARHQAEQAKRRAQLQQLAGIGENKKKEYISFVEDVARRYGLDPKLMTIDPESRIVRDVKEAPQK